jgi:hypothetical protein
VYSRSRISRGREGYQPYGQIDNPRGQLATDYEQQNILQVLALVTPRPTPLPTNRTHTCKMTFSSLVIQITIAIADETLLNTRMLI